MFNLFRNAKGRLRKTMTIVSEYLSVLYCSVRKKCLNEYVRLVKELLSTGVRWSHTGNTLVFIAPRLWNSVSKGGAVKDFISS